MYRLFIIVLLLPCISFGQTNADKNLVAWYNFNGNSKDLSGHNNNPLVDHSTPAEDRHGKKDSARYFNGKTDFIQIKNNSSLNPEEITLLAIIKPMGFYKGTCHNNSIIEKGEWDYKPGNYAIRFTAGEYTHGDCYDSDTAHQNFVGMASNTPGKTSRDIYVVPGTWYHIVFTFNKEYCRLYIDGELITSFGSAGKLGKNKDDLFLGKKDNAQYPYWFKGVIDEVRIYNRSLLSDEVAALYEELK